MNVLHKIRNICGVCGFVSLYMAVSTSDYYFTELHAKEPHSVVVMAVVGAVLILPALIGLFIGKEEV